MKLFIDDLRECPSGFELARDYDEAVKFIETRKVTHVSFDHDLGEEPDGSVKKSGYDVAKWLEERVYTDDTFPIPVMTVHSANPRGIINLKLAIKSIERAQERR